MKSRLKTALLSALAAAQASGELPPGEAPGFTVERPREQEHGDLAANLAMQLAKPFKMNPRLIAEALLRHIGDGEGLFAKKELAGPGFMNFFIQPSAWLDIFREVLDAGPDYGRSALGGGQRVLVEFVSANPTGPLHVGHGRGAALGDALARLLQFAGFAVDREYYLNDTGNQMATLGRSLLARARQAQGSEEEFPQDHYRGDYLKDMAARFLNAPEGQALEDLASPQAVGPAAAWAGQRILNTIRLDLEAFHVSMDQWFSERSLVEKGAVEAAFATLEQCGYLYQEDGALWFRAREFGDEKDRVVRRGNGEITYFASDIAYHLDKFVRGYTRLIDVWGADHHGYIPRVKAAIKGMGRDPGELEVLLVQMVNLLRGGEPVPMSTRGGEFVTLRQVVDEVGADAARFIFLTRRSEAQLDFDLEVAKQKSLDNPVFYVQYAHTRVQSLLRKAREMEPRAPSKVGADLSPLALPEELALARRLSEFPELIESAAFALAPHRITYYLQEVAGLFHSYYNAQRILAEDPVLAAARLVLARAVGTVIRNGLNLLGVSAPEEM